MRLVGSRYFVNEVTSYMDVVGIDVSKADFHACLIQGSANAKKSFPNANVGYRQVLKWLKNRGCTQVHVCMEATGAYWLGLATALYQAGLGVSVVNPSRTAMFARSQLRRTKTDRVDSEMIAHFVQTQTPDLWTPPPPQILELRGLLTYRGQLVNQRTKLKQVVKQVVVNEMLQALHDQQLAGMDQLIKSIEEQMRNLLGRYESLQNQVNTVMTIPGFGFISAASVVAKLPMDRLRDSKAAAAYIGVTPSERQSGTSILGKPRICKTGNAELRRDLYMPAVVAMRFNPALSAFAARLKAKGKPSKVIIVAVMRKLIVLAFALLKSQESFNPTLAAARP